MSERRARNSVNYLVNKGIDRKRFVAKGLGEDNFLAINTNADGSDNPEGRVFNRRVEIKILNSTNAAIKTKPVTVPDHLRIQKDASEYYIFVTETEKELPSGYFSKYNSGAFDSILSHRIQKGYVYTAGTFKHRSEAVEMLNTIAELGFPNARIIGKGELDEMKSGFYEALKSEIERDEIRNESNIFTIQIKALRKPADLEKFPGLKGVKEELGADDIYRYTYREIKGYNPAKEELDKVKALGYEDAFLVRIKETAGLLMPQEQEGQYTIQISAIQSPKPVSRFKKLGTVTEFKGKDGIYRYSYGRFASIGAARKELLRVKEAGFEDAFIVNVNRYNDL
ncbi:MAG: SPOR domain-containing protein [Bacteroidetes bacterium]|nr:SPOR domain-containing protein [Bacteroidota bacterium]